MDEAEKARLEEEKQELTSRMLDGGISDGEADRLAEVRRLLGRRDYMPFREPGDTPHGRDVLLALREKLESGDITEQEYDRAAALMGGGGEEEAPVEEGGKALRHWAGGLSRAVGVLESLAANAEKAGKFDEGKHPRAADGKFGSGGGGAKEGDAPEDAAPPGPPVAADAPAASGHAAAFAQFKSGARREAEGRHEQLRQEADAIGRQFDDAPTAVGQAALRPRWAAAREQARQAEAQLAEEERLDFQAWAQHKAGLGGGRVTYYEYPGTKWKEEERVRMVAAHDLVASVLPAGHEVPRIAYDRAKEGRAYYAYGRVHVTRADDAGTYAHEIGHHLEDKIPGAKEKVNAFLEARCGGEQPASLREKFGASFGAGEEGRADDFGKLFPGDEAAAFYVGKTYPGGETEVLSMGLELLYRRPQFFARTDPEFFNLVVGIVGGAGKKEEREAKDKEKDKKEPGGGKA